MNQKESETNFQIIQENSLGEQKACEDSKHKKKVIFITALSVLIFAFVLCLAVGLCFTLKNTIQDSYKPISSSESKENDYNGYSRAQVLIYKDLRVMALLERNDFTDYEKTDGGSFDYHYKAEDYETINELDESYLYGFYSLTSERTFNEVLKALGYIDLNDFLIKSQYVDDNGKPSIKAWKEANLVFISGIMKEQNYGSR